MRNLLKNWKIVLLISLLIFSFIVVSFNGIKLGVDFNGGTLFQIHLAEKATPDQMSSIKQTVQQRLDWTGLKDTKVNVWGDEFIIAQIAETDPETVEKLEALLQKQGKFEVTLGEHVLFTGADIIQIPKDPSKGYGFYEQDGAVQWTVPFVLKESAAKGFSHGVFHRCTITSYDPQYGKQYDCDRTYFFIDRPKDAVLVIPDYLYNTDRELLLQGNRMENISDETDIKELLLNAGLPYVVVDENLGEGQLAELEGLRDKYEKALTIPQLATEDKAKIAALGFEVVEIGADTSAYADAFEQGAETGLQGQSVKQNLPWVWQVTGAKQVISLSEDVTNMEPYVERVQDAKILSSLVIRGYSDSVEDAQADLSDLTIILESGSLPIPVDNVSKETVSPSLGGEFLQNVLFIGIISLLVVSLVIFIRYRRMKLAAPILFTGLSEITLILGFASLIGWNLDLAAVAGILAVVGTGVDDQIIITDELIRGERHTGTVVERVKRAFFIIFAAAATTIGAMAPIILFGFGMGKLVGFAITTIAGVVIGITITRPAFSEMAKHVLRDEEH